MPTKNILYIQEYKLIEGKKKRWKKYAMQAITKAELKWLYQDQKKIDFKTQTVNRDKKNSTKVLIYGQSIRKKQQL